MLNAPCSHPVRLPAFSSSPWQETTLELKTAEAQLAQAGLEPCLAQQQLRLAPPVRDSLASSAAAAVKDVAPSVMLCAGCSACAVQPWQLLPTVVTEGPMVYAELQQSEQQLAYTAAAGAGTQVDGVAVRQVSDIQDGTLTLGGVMRIRDAGWLQGSLGSPQAEDSQQADETQVGGGLSGGGVGRSVCMWEARHNRLSCVGTGLVVV